MNVADVFSIMVISLFVAGYVWWFFSRKSKLPCPVWLSWMVECENPFTQANRSTFIIEKLHLQPGMKVLDAGCGPGRLTIPMGEKVAPHGVVTALDVQSGMLQKVKEKAQKAHLGTIQYVHAELGSGKLPCNEYDRICLVTVLGEIPDQVSAMRELFDAVKPAGILSITEVIFDPHFQSRKKVVALAAEVGFQQVNMFGNRFVYTIHFKK
jgi:ubiquinone/menaquinone biosynthesis C-methylase UbiE